MSRLLLCTVLPLFACGYSARPDHGQERLGSGRLPTVAVLPFDTTSFRRGLEIELTRLLADEVRARSPQSPRSADRADWHVTGTILRAFERVLSEDSDDFVRQSSFWVTAEIVLRDRETDTIIGTTEITKHQPFSDRAGRFRTSDQAAAEVLREIAEATVYWLEATKTKKRLERSLMSDPKKTTRAGTSRTRAAPVPTRTRNLPLILLLSVLALMIIVLTFVDARAVQARRS